MSTSHQNDLPVSEKKKNRELFSDLEIFLVLVALGIAGAGFLWRAFQLLQVLIS